MELDQLNWTRMADYTWEARSRERHFDAHQHVTSEHEEGWETLILDGQPYRRNIERDNKALPVDEQRKQQEKLDRAVAKLQKETPEQKQRRMEDYEKNRRRERAFLLEVADAYDFKLEGEQKIDGRDVWVISGVPKPNYHAKTRDAADLRKIRGKLWIEKSSYQWVRLEAETTQTISFGVFLTRLNPGAKLVFEQVRVNDEVWLPKRVLMSGSGRIGLVKRLAEDQEITWSNYKKFQVESKIVSSTP